MGHDQICKMREELDKLHDESDALARHEREAIDELNSQLKRADVMVKSAEQMLQRASRLFSTTAQFFGEARPSVADAQHFFSHLHRFIDALEAASQEVSGGALGTSKAVQKRAWIESQLQMESLDAGTGMIDRMMQ